MMESDRVQVLESIKQELLDKNFVVVPQRTVGTEFPPFASYCGIRPRFRSSYMYVVL